MGSPGTCGAGGCLLSSPTDEAVKSRCRPGSCPTRVGRNRSCSPGTCCVPGSGSVPSSSPAAISPRPGRVPAALGCAPGLCCACRGVPVNSPHEQPRGLHCVLSPLGHGGSERKITHPRCTAASGRAAASLPPSLRPRRAPSGTGRHGRWGKPSFCHFHAGAGAGAYSPVLSHQRGASATAQRCTSGHSEARIRLSDVLCSLLCRKTAPG